MYRFIFRVFFARMDPERAHHVAFAVIRRLPGFFRGFFRPDASLRVTALGLTFDSPFGIAAGFDKQGTGIRGLGILGFGHVEVGTITAIAQPGNEKPRLFRLIPDRAVINRMGFNNRGAASTALVVARARAARRRPIIGINIGKSRVVDVDAAIADYLESTRIVAPLADYLVVNVSSPNTPGLRGLQELDKLTPLLTSVKAAAGRTPVLVKIAPDLTDDEARKVAKLAARLLDGIIATNTTLSRAKLVTPAAVVEAAGVGGLSGPPVAARSLELLKLIRAEVPADFCVISVGGVETAADVRERLASGATLVQGYTAFLYRGPFWGREINRGLRAES
ncbi:MAG: quinone-dependent dihydroorotate dehydrogenase [Salinibacterium sp.]|nr:quinone-dependent dihydroorotate dehydrogenase [Salinibacterium sp.]